MQEVKNKWGFTTEPFGAPTLSAVNNGTASWDRGSTPALTQKGSSGWLAKLTGGAQTNDDFGRVNIPVNEMHLPSFATAKWSYYMTATESMGVNIVIWVHDPTDFDKRAEITQIGGHADLEKSAGWNAHEFTSATGGMFYYGENISSSDLIAGNQYTWSQFISDALFKTWDIYRITIEHGWEVSGSFSSVYVADIQLDGKTIALKPSMEELTFLQSETDANKDMFGEPTLRSSADGNATWSRWHHQKGGTGWTAKLYGGIQTSLNDWARLMIPVNEMPFTDLSSASWTWNNTNQENEGLVMAIYLHDPTNNDKRIEMTMLASHGDIDKATGWNHHVMGVTTDYWYWYGEDDPAPQVVLSEGVPNYHGLDDFQADTTLESWTIYRIDFLWGGQTGGVEFKDIWIADIKINGQVITLKPDSSGTGRFGIKTYTGSGHITTTNAKLSPKTPYRLLSVSCLNSGVQGGASSFVVNTLSEAGTVYDIPILTDDMYVPTTRLSLYATFGQGYEFGMDDELDILYTNQGSVTYGIVYRYEILVD